MRVFSKINGTSTYIPHYQGNNYELYLSDSELICAIDPDIINDYINNKHYSSENPEEEIYFKSEVSYRPIIDGEVQSYTTSVFNWVNNSIYINNYKNYIKKKFYF